jgi:succinate dehydrogenase / fumarate reductase flavoprotein subunit
MYEQFHALGDVDITKQPMEVYPTIHYTMGGIASEAETCASSIPGLYAAGECAAGLHGANRLGGNSLTDILVFGKRAGDAAAACAKTAAHGEIDPLQVQEEQAILLDPLVNSGMENPFTLSQELQEAMQEGAMIARTEEGLAKCLNTVLELQQRAAGIRVTGDRRYNPGWQTARDIRFMLKLSEIIVRCALERKESRGAQWRTDYPDKDEEWGKKNLLAHREGESVRLSTKPVAPMPPHLKALFDEPK